MNADDFEKIVAKLKVKLDEAERERVRVAEQARREEAEWKAELDRRDYVHPQELLNRKAYWDQFDDGPKVVSNYDPFDMYDRSVPSFVRRKVDE
jgi:hypothetical protein